MQEQLKSTIKDLQFEVKEANNKIENLTYDLERARAELHDIREANKDLDLTKFSQEKSISDF
jgi:hypothetical protein